MGKNNFARHSNISNYHKHSWRQMSWDRLKVLRERNQKCVMCLCVRADVRLAAGLFPLRRKEPLIGRGLYKQEEGRAISSQPPPVPLK